jgi:GST-like protein
VFESAAILQYLAEKTGRLLPADPRQRSVAIQWLTWQVANVGPMGGQAAHFTRYAPVTIDYAIERYTKEVVRLLTILERRLGEARYLAGDDYSIADIAAWPGRWMPAEQAEQYQHLAVVLRDRRASCGDARARGRQGRADQVHAAQGGAVADEWSNLFGEKMWGAVRL